MPCPNGPFHRTQELVRFGVSVAGCVEKGDFAALLKETWLKREKHFEAEQSRAAQKAKEDVAAQAAREQRARDEAAAQAARDLQRKKDKEAAVADEKVKEVEAARIVAEVEVW